MGNTTGKPAAGLSKTELERMHRRFRRLAGGEDRLSLATLYEQPDLSGNTFVHRIFRLFDTDQDGYLTWDDFSAGIRQICGLATEDDQSLCFMRFSTWAPKDATRHDDIFPKNCNCTNHCICAFQRTFSVSPEASAELTGQAAQKSLLVIAVAQHIIQPDGDAATESQNFGEPLLHRHISHNVAFRLYDTDQSGRVSEKELTDALKLSGSQQATEAQLQKIVSNTIAEHDRDQDGELSLLEFRAMLRHSQQDSGSDF